MNILEKLKIRLDEKHEKENVNDKIIKQAEQEKIIETDSKENYRKEIVKSLSMLNVKYNKHLIHNTDSDMHFDFSGYLEFDFDKDFEILEKSNRLDTIPVLFWTLLLRSSEIKSKFVKKISSLSDKLSGKTYLSISKEFRERKSMTWAAEWKDIDINYFIEDYMTEDERIMVLGLASFHPDGYFREKAINELIRYKNPKIIPFIIIRTCDWVYEIRKEAQNMLLKKIEIDNLTHIVKNILLIDKIRENIDGLKTYYGYYDVKEKRIKEDEVFLQKTYSTIESILNDRKNKSTVCNILSEAALSKDEYVQKYALNKIIINDLLQHKEMIELTSKVKNQITCVKSMKLILEKLSDEEVIEFKDNLDKINGSRAKAEFITKLYECGCLKSVEDFKPYALSKYASVREIARFYMRKSSFNDFFKFYADISDTMKNNKIAILGMCETCNTQDIDMVLKYFKNSTKKIKRKILNRVISLSDIEPCCDYKIFFEALESGCESIIKLCRVYIRQNSELFDNEELYDLYIHTDVISAKLALAEVLCSGNGWKSLLYALKLLEDEHKIGFNLGTKNIERWIYEKRLYLIKDKKTGKVKHYFLSKMNDYMAENFRYIMKKNGHLLGNDTREIIEGLLLNYIE